MSQFRAAKLDIGCFAKIRNIRDHTKRKVYSENEPERYAPLRPHVAQELTMTQASPPIHHSQHHSPATSPRASSASALTDALLHTLHTDQEQVYNGRQGPWCL
ncbi:glucocorticoid receptor-like (DNA-binding domain) [Alternaria alternata]|nr:glucocorticoid receptor-like (DNA-binding domain) [Alternaria alternata]